MQLDIFDNSEGLRHRSRGWITFAKLSIHEKINVRGYYQFMPWNYPSGTYQYLESSYIFYVKQGLTEKLDDYFFIAQKYHYEKKPNAKNRTKSKH